MDHEDLEDRIVEEVTDWILRKQKRKRNEEKYQGVVLFWFSNVKCSYRLSL